MIPSLSNWRALGLHKHGFFQIGAIIVYTFVFNMLAPPLEEADSNEKQSIVIKVEASNDKGRSPLPQMTYDGNYSDSIEVPLLHPRPAPSTLVKVLNHSQVTKI